MIIDHSEAWFITYLEKDVYLAFHTNFNSLELRRWVGGIPNTSPHNERLIMCANPKYVFYAQHMSSLDGRGEDSGEGRYGETEEQGELSGGLGLGGRK